MYKFSKFILIILTGQAWSIPSIPQIGDEEEMIKVNGNNIYSYTPQTSKDIIDLSFYGDAIYGDPDDKYTAQLVANYTPETYSVNPEELGTYLEGDILIPRQMFTKNGINSQSSRWSKGIVPYEIRGNFNTRDMSIIEHAIREYHRRTCIRFIPRTTERDYISIVSGNSGCWSSVGRVGGKQEVNLQSPGCLIKPGTAIHELMHALGFLHEQNREERDAYVGIQYQNIQPNAISNFDRASKTLAFGVPYDYGSVMHYSTNAFSMNGKPTIIAMQNTGGAQMGQRNGFSAFDVEKINKMYDCGYDRPSLPAPTPVPSPIPAPIFIPTTIEPAPALGTLPSTGSQSIDNSIINSFVNGILAGLGLGDDSSA